jgi:hypothetical protein
MRIAVALILFFAAAEVNAQSSRQVTTRYLAWGGLFEQFTFSNRWNATYDMQFRYEYTDNDWFAMLFRPGLTYVAKNKLTLTAGGGYMLLYPNPNSRPARREWRIWQEAGRKFPTKSGMFYPRVRTEQRFIREYDNEGLADDFTYHSFRVRLRCDWTLPLGKDAGKGFFVSAGDEIFFARLANGFSVFDQNRAYAGVGYRFSKTFALHLQYLNLYQQLSSTRYELHHVARLTILHELDLRKNENK